MKDVSILTEENEEKNNKLTLYKKKEIQIHAS